MSVRSESHHTENRPPRLGLRSRRRVRASALIGLSVAALFVAARSSAATGPAVSTPTPADVATGRNGTIRPFSTVTTGADNVVHMPAGFEATEAGARAAGIAYVSTVEQKMLYLDDPSIEQVQRQISAADRIEQLLADRRRSVATWRSSVESGHGQLWWVVTPLASKVETFTSSQARVQVWVSFVVSRSGAAAPRVWFGIQTVDLVRERDDWKVWAQSVEGGPNPQLAPTSKPSDATELGERLSGFQLLGADR